MEPLEGMTGSDEKGSDNDDSLLGSNGKKRKSPGVEKNHSTSGRPDNKGHDGEKVGSRKSKKVASPFSVRNLAFVVFRFARQSMCEFLASLNLASDQVLSKLFSTPSSD